MKRVLLVLLLVTGVALAAPKVGSSVTIRVLSAKVMKSPKFIGPSAGTVSRGDQLTVKQVKGDWYLVEGSYNGWIHKSNVTEGKVALSSKPGGNGGNVNRDEVELAGRGFTPEVEQQYKEKNPNLDFSHVDAIEKTAVDPTELEAFVTEGGLK
ncbi:MAG TPA: hypothetical protein VLB44_04040 [Kofleriaceae bacterium]|nr:hypothetical protein [Kofleriaceae bacterium]